MPGLFTKIQLCLIAQIVNRELVVGLMIPILQRRKQLTQQGTDLAFYPSLLASKAHGFFGVWHSISDIQKA